MLNVNSIIKEILENTGHIHGECACLYAMGICDKIKVVVATFKSNVLCHKFVHNIESTYAGCYTTYSRVEKQWDILLGNIHIIVSTSRYKPLSHFDIDCVTLTHKKLYHGGVSMGQMNAMCFNLIRTTTYVQGRVDGLLLNRAVYLIRNGWHMGDHNNIIVFALRNQVISYISQYTYHHCPFCGISVKRTPDSVFLKFPSDLIVHTSCYISEFL